MMGLGELVLILGTLGAVALQGLAYAALIAWGAWAARRQGGRWWWALPVLPVASVVVSAAGLVANVGVLAYGFESVGQAPPENKAQTLSQWIELGMASTAGALGVSVLLLGAAVVGALVGTVRRPPAG